MAGLDFSLNRLKLKEAMKKLLGIMIAKNSTAKMIAVLRDARNFLARPDNDFAWSSWNGAEDALAEIDSLISRLELGDLPPRLDLEVLFAVTGPIQEVSLSSGWGNEFLKLADRFDAAVVPIYR